MKKYYSLGLSAALLLSSLGAQAQNWPDGPAFPLGSSQALVQQLETQVAASAARGAGPTVTLRVSAAKAFAGQVNYRQDLAKTGEYVVGEIAGVAGSSFSLRIEGKAVDGSIVLRNTRQAYRYTADAAGNASVQPVDINKVICIDYNRPTGYREAAPAPGSTANRTAVVSLQSYSGARGCVLLDFDGQYVAGTPWNNGNPINAASFNMTDANIQAFWELVSEDYRPFNLNITTDEAVFNAYPKTMRMRCIVTPTNTAAPGAGGVAYVTSFKGNDDTPCWVFMADPKYGGEAASHEIGHTLGLSHDGRLNPKEEYYDAQSTAGTWAPIMGAGYYKPVTHWSRGEYNSASNQEDDLAIMSGATYNLGYRNDDHSNTIGGATNLARSGANLSGSGVIERTSDQDYFAFSTAGGTVNLSVNTVGRYGNLDIVARLFNSGGGLLGTYDTAGGGNLNVSFSAGLGAGTYYLQVDGTSSGNPATDGYSDYASLGTFSISGSAPAPVSGVATVFRDCNYSGAATTLPVGDYTLAALQSRGVINDDISSLTVNGGYEVVLYENDNFAGAAIVLGTYSCLLNNGWNDRASSLRVRPASVAFSRLLEAEANNVNNGMIAEGCSEGGQDMGYIDPGDYLVFNAINFPASGSYLIEYRVSSGAGGGTLSADLNAGTIPLGSVGIPATGGWQNWTTVSHTVNINAGTYNFGVFAQTAGWNINWLRITKVGVRAAASAPLAETSKTLEAYPNPGINRLSLRAAQDLAGSPFQIVDSWGRPVASGSVAAEAVDISALKPGMYTLVVQSPENGKLTTRFSKE